MNKIIVTTTIHQPSEALERFARMDDWELIIVGDVQTPHECYVNLASTHPSVRYLGPDYQEREYKALSDAIGWRSIQRRNIGFVEAYRRGADVVATVDDDNIPYENWGKNVLVGREVEIDLYECDAPVFDPLSVTSNSHLWHRGYPIELLSERHRVRFKGRAPRRVLVQADLWNGDPDIDAVARLAFRPSVRFDDVVRPYGSETITPFNSQNTFIAREVLPHYAVIPHVGRMDDIWGAYLLQHRFPNSVVFNSPSVYQDRNEQDLITNLENELIGYRSTMSLVRALDEPHTVLPQRATDFYAAYLQQFEQL